MALDLYGRGYSDAAPQGIPNNLALFISCLSELLFAIARETDQQSVTSITLVGYSMGGAIAAEFARRYPFLVSRLILLAPAGLPVPIPWTARLIQSPVIGGAIFNMGAQQAMLSHVERGYYQPDSPAVHEHKENVHTRLSQLFAAHKGSPSFVSPSDSLFRSILCL